MATGAPAPRLTLTGGGSPALLPRGGSPLRCSLPPVPLGSGPPCPVRPVQCPQGCASPSLAPTTLPCFPARSVAPLLPSAAAGQPLPSPGGDEPLGPAHQAAHPHPTPGGPSPRVPPPGVPSPCLTQPCPGTSSHAAQRSSPTPVRNRPGRADPQIRSSPSHLMEAARLSEPNPGPTPHLQPRRGRSASQGLRTPPPSCRSPSQPLWRDQRLQLGSAFHPSRCWGSPHNHDLPSAPTRPGGLPQTQETPSGVSERALGLVTGGLSPSPVASSPPRGPRQ